MAPYDHQTLGWVTWGAITIVTAGWIVFEFRHVLRRLRLVVWSLLLFCSLFLVFSMADTRWNKDYCFDVPQLKPPLDGGEADHRPHVVDQTGPEQTRQNTLYADFIKANITKINEEISKKSEHIAWQFNNKFILVSGLFGLSILFFQERLKNLINSKPPLPIKLIDNDLVRLSSTNLTCTILAISVIICISLDIHERANMSISNAHGQWIARYIEGPILGHAGEAAAGHGALASYQQCSDPNKEGPRNGWESSLRIRYDDSLPDPKPVEGLHHDRWGHLLFAIQFHYLTIVLYIIYVALLHLTYSKDNKTKKRMNRLHSRIALTLLLTVQISILMFAIITRESSEISEVKVIPIGLEWLSGGIDWLACRCELADLRWLFSSGNVEWLSGVDALKMAGFIGLIPTLLLLPFIMRLVRVAFPRTS